jgi:hypothetical protein
MAVSTYENADALPTPYSRKGLLPTMQTSLETFKIRKAWRTSHSPVTMSWTTPSQKATSETKTPQCRHGIARALLYLSNEKRSSTRRLAPRKGKPVHRLLEVSLKQQRLAILSKGT